MVTFEKFVKSMVPCFSKPKITPTFCFPKKIPVDVTATNATTASYRTRTKLKAAAAEL